MNPVLLERCDLSQHQSRRRAERSSSWHLRVLRLVLLELSQSLPALLDATLAILKLEVEGQSLSVYMKSLQWLTVIKKLRHY